MRRFEILMRVVPPRDGLRFAVIETMNTADGPRSRICDRRYATLPDAKASVAVMEAGQ